MITKIFDYGMNGEGVGKAEGKILLIPNALLDEELDADIVKDFGNYATANVNYICEPSINRIDPPCPYFAKCGGCDLQHMSYDEQLRFKRTLVKKTIKKIANIDTDVRPTIACDHEYKYRNKISINIDLDHSGYYHEGTKDIINIDQCMLANNNIQHIYSKFRTYLASLDNATRSKLKNIVIRSIENQTLIGIVAKDNIDISDFYTILDNTNIGLYLIINKRKDSVVLSGKVIHIAGIKNIEIHNYGLTYFVDLMSFHQTNIDIQDKIYSKVLEYIKPDSRVINGFSGQGLLTAAISSVSLHTIGIEINESAHKSAEELKKINHIDNMTNILGDFNIEISRQKDADILVLDPSKKGCGEKVLSNISTDEIIYISCNPIALAKDLKILIKKYNIQEVIPFDMFPNTKSVETLVKLKIKEK
ncbi:MAG: 23S rRNA (uracil(1939)-C(5))-methyltransferase RlmD [Clostridia bacterium]